MFSPREYDLAPHGFLAQFTVLYMNSVFWSNL